MKNKPYLINRVIIISSIFSIIIFIEALILCFSKNEILLDLISKFLIVEPIIFLSCMYFLVIVPFREINKVFIAFSKNYTKQDLFELRYGINREHEAMLEELNKILDSNNIIKASKKQAEYLALQNQINPHFLYNTLESIRSEALLGGLPIVSEMTESLARFFRYTISNTDTLVTIEDELDNVNTYWKIQQFRFYDRMALSIDYSDVDEKIIQNTKIPKLILQPIVENAISHGIEPLVEGGIIKIRFLVTATRLIITISDNGVGMDKNTLDKLNNSLRGPRLNFEKNNSNDGSIAMTNVNTRIKLIFGDEYGMCVYSNKNLGTDVEIMLPIGSDKEYEKRSA